MSISKQQAAALAEGFLDNLGTDKDDFRPKESFTEIILLAGELVEDAQKNLIASNKNSSGALSASLIADEPTQNGSILRVDTLMNYYGAFVNKGVKGTRSGQSLAGYSFRNEIVSRKMLADMQGWVDRAKISTRSVKKYSAAGRHEKKTKSISQIDNAYAVARSVKQHGLKPTGFLDKAVKNTSNKVSDRLGAALRIDVIDGLKGLNG